MADALRCVRTSVVKVGGWNFWKAQQAGRPPRVRRATFIPHTRRLCAQALRVTSGFGSLGPLAQSLDAAADDLRALIRFLGAEPVEDRKT